MYFSMILIGLAIFERLVVDLGPNIELVTMASVLAGAYLGGRRRYLVPLIIMAVSDLVLGWGYISLFTWSGFLMMAGLPAWWRKAGVRTAPAAVMSGISGVLLFYVWTNFGVWVTDGWGMYSRDFTGLMMAYVNGLPFLRLQLTSVLIFVPVGVLVVELVRNWGKNMNKVRFAS